MEKTSRKSIEHKIKVSEYDKPPELLKMSDELVNKVKDYLRRKKPANAFKRIATIYKLVDAIIAEMEPITVCRKGCAWCCAIPVEIMPIEIKYIEKNTSWKRQKTGFIPIAGQEHNFGYCPLLDQKTGSCSVYEYRPFNCRAFVVYDSPEYCKRGYQGEEIRHWTNGGPENGFGNNALLYLSMDLIRTELNIQRDLEYSDKDILEKRVTDIRCYFK